VQGVDQGFLVPPEETHPILIAYHDNDLPRAGLRYDQPADLGALLYLDAHYADRFMLERLTGIEPAL
jgi:hypothetical protein